MTVVSSQHAARTHRALRDVQYLHLKWSRAARPLGLEVKDMSNEEALLDRILQLEDKLRNQLQVLVLTVNDQHSHEAIQRILLDLGDFKRACGSEQPQGEKAAAANSGGAA